MRRTSFVSNALLHRAAACLGNRDRRRHATRFHKGGAATVWASPPRGGPLKDPHTDAGLLSTCANLGRLRICFFEISVI